MKDKALEYIVKLYLLFENGDKNNLENTQKIMYNIYRFAHCVQENSVCYNSHNDWREELNKQDWDI